MLQSATPAMLKFDPAVVSGGSTMPLPAAVLTLIPGTTIFDRLAKLIGRAPRGEYQKFQREAYPLMFRQAQARNTPVFIYWFRGEIIQVNPDGGFKVAASNIGSAQIYEEWLTDAGKRFNNYGVFCRDTLVDCEFRFFGQALADDTVIPGNGNGKPKIQTAGIFTLGGLVIMGIAGLVLWFVFGGK